MFTYYTYVHMCACICQIRFEFHTHIYLHIPHTLPNPPHPRLLCVFVQSNLQITETLVFINNNCITSK